MLDLSADVGGLKLRLPLMPASGILGGSPDALEAVAKKAKVGALVTKTLTLEPRKGNDPPIVVSTPCGLVNAVGLANPGVKVAKELVEVGRKYNLPVVVSIAGKDEREFAEAAWASVDAGASALELNLSCPHAKGLGLELGMDINAVRKVVEAVATTVNVPVFAKLGLVDKLVDTASAALDAGASGLVLINTIRAMVIDIDVMEPVLTNKVGGLSGRAIHPIAVRAVYEVYKELKAPIVGVGGVYEWRDAVELVLAGASAVQIGSAVADKGLGVFSEVLAGLAWWLHSKGFRSLREAVGAAVR
ncbi:dihydroorotate dehydrogenase PyrD [Ignicoccus hospitalis]|uniref:Dihydroorotate dehydrogenase n=1 Tax=Ignicoccus hospitalis (strain KIN4/I / DSM 18386 / JCM 14125) TaxID=453591 RepID=A8A909_IGNH4|nr:dihydroorotate dehydrogenase PyrD [Ignicoccus hospitalis]ABU81411.1 dihydroorotate oxidase B, catalytic subunit [Ignicoccus hospitalis KIN4/I]HIH90282.1 dihydroorotate dehydrogenase [Desulfurococcaceae archaeon]